MSNPNIAFLTEHSEYSVLCDQCPNESTRDGSREIAIRNAEREGFHFALGLGALCAECLKKIEPSLVQ